MAGKWPGSGRAGADAAVVSGDVQAVTSALAAFNATSTELLVVTSDQAVTRLAVPAGRQSLVLLDAPRASRAIRSDGWEAIQLDGRG
jgi:hypothetical protein